MEKADDENLNQLMEDVNRDDFKNSLANLIGKGKPQKKKPMSLLNYKQQESQPAWFKENDDHFYHSVTSGSSPFNEWYEFESEEDALDFALTFESQSVIDRYSRVTVDGKDRWYDNDDVIYVDDTEEYSVTPDATPASFADLAQAESRF